MKTRAPVIRHRGSVLAPARRTMTGFLLIEMLIYMALFLVVVGFATVVFFRFWDETKGLRRDADDIVRVLHVGDQWRTDVRSAVGPLELAHVNNGDQLRIPSRGGDIVYTISGTELRRSAGGSTNRLWLSNIKASRMDSDPRENVSAWRWELELKTVKTTSFYKPLFTFESVAGGGHVQ